MTTRKPLAIAVLVVFPAVCLALEPGEAESANALAMGWTGAADAFDNAAITANPAAIGLESRAGMDGQFTYGPHPYLGWGASAIDSQSSQRVALGVAWRRSSGDQPLQVADLPGWSPAGETPTNIKRYQEVTTAVAVPLAQRRLALGVNGTFAILSHDRQGRGFTGNMDAGFALRVSRAITLGVTGRSLLPIADQIDRPASIEGALRYDLPELGALALNLDRRLEEGGAGPLSLGVGAEKAAGTARLRAGYAWREDRHWVTAGLGAENEAGAVEYGVAVPLNAKRAGAAIHQISVRITPPRMY